MNVIKDYELRAQECEALARLSMREHRLPILQMAEMWRRLAAERREALGEKALGDKALKHARR